MEILRRGKMAPCLRVRHVVKTDRSDTHELIQAICGIKPDGCHWSLTQDEAISQIEDGIAVFYVERAGGRRFEVIVAMDSCPQIPQNGRGWRTAGQTSLSTELPEPRGRNRSEEHTSELQSRFDLVCRLLLEKK